MQVEEPSPRPNILRRPETYHSDQFKVALPIASDELLFEWSAKGNKRIAAALDGGNIPRQGPGCMALPPLGFIDVEQATDIFWKVILASICKSLSAHFTSPKFNAAVHKKTARNRCFPPDNSFFAVLFTHTYRPFLIKSIRCNIRRSYMTGEEWDLEIYCKTHSYSFSSYVEKHSIDYGPLEFETGLDTIIGLMLKLCPDLKRREMKGALSGPAAAAAAVERQQLQVLPPVEAGIDEEIEYDYSSSSSSSSSEEDLSISSDSSSD